jgi:segregation and condensation protein A
LVERLEVIVRFLAVLELYKRGWIELAQRHNLADLEVTWQGTEGEDREAPALSQIEEYQG